mgnify:FL=1
MNQEKIGKFIAERRKECNLTQEELAEKLSVNSRSISRWENGKCMPDMSMYNSICEVLGISINEFLSGEKLKKDEYQDKFEKNMIDVVGTVELKNKTIRIFNLVILFVAVFLISVIVFNFLLDHVYIKQNYDKRTMNVTFENHSLKLTTPVLGNTKYVYFEYENECLAFVTYYENLGTIINKNKKFNEFTGYDLSENTYTNDLYVSDSCLKKRKKVYYTKQSLSHINKIYKSNDKTKLDKVMSKSNLLYETKVS